MVDDLAEDGDGAAGRGIAGEDEDRTLPESGMARPAAASPTEARKGT
jgi:hypothetical protein